MSKYRILTAFAFALSAPTVAQTETPPVAATQPPIAETGFSMHLICRGTGERKVATFGSAYAFSGSRSAYALGSGQQLSQFGEQLDVDIQSNKGKVRVPRRFLPAFHGGDGGWFDVQELAISDVEITGKVAINFAQHPNLRIDRRSGSVALDGKVGSFSGQCEKFNPDQRAF